MLTPDEQEIVRRFTENGLKLPLEVPANVRDLLTLGVMGAMAQGRQKGCCFSAKELAATLKQRRGTGGTVKDGRIEIQGDQRERIVAELERLGYKVKRVGG
jgi:hypothetical protein